MAIGNEPDFSNWLAQNIEVLNEHVAWDIDPSSIQREKSTPGGWLRVDLFCRATKLGDDEPFNVVIENQLRETDLDHLARIFMYITEFDAQGAIWIAGETTYYYERVIHWLNNNATIDAYLFKMDIDEQDVPKLTPVIYPGMSLDALKTLDSDPGDNWRYKARTWFERVLPKVALRCKSYGVLQTQTTNDLIERRRSPYYRSGHSGIWQTQTTRDLRQPGDTMLWCRQSVLHHDKRVSEYISWYIELHSNFSRVGVYVPKQPSR